MIMRIGQGYDIHPLAPGRPLWLGGIHVPHDQGLLGDSDADVLLHATMDAILGAAGLGDLGCYFARDHVPPGYSSAKMMAEVMLRVSAAGFGVGNCDATVIAEKPALSPYRDAMQAMLRDLLGTSAVTVKFKTADGVGAIGNEKAMAALASVLLMDGDQSELRADK